MSELPEHLPLSEQQIDTLATYNGEVRRGLKHHDYWHREMARLQRIFDLQHAWSCDLLPSERAGNHIQDDVLKHLEGWDLMVAHPPCTRLCNSGVCWLEKRNLWKDMEQACDFFLALLNAPIPRIAVENPIPHKYARERIGHYQQQIHPWLFGEPESKATCLWLRNLPPLMCTGWMILPVDKRKAQRLHWLPPSPERAHLRSVTFQGIADAMAAQWP